MKVKKKMIISLIFVAMLLMLKNVSYAGTQKWNSLDYNVTLNDDGSMDVVETWDIYISETNTVLKNFELDSDKYSGITNVKVKNIDTGEELTQIYKEMYHVTKNCYYALPISDGKFEIAWGVGLDNSSANRKYAISYKIEDAVTVYNDCSELYWQFLGTDNAIPADRITGTIKLPKAVNDIEKLRVWAHGPLNGESQKSSHDTVTFNVDDFYSKTMLEVRVVTEEPIFEQSTKINPQNKLRYILEEEEKWAGEANLQREIIQSKYDTIMTNKANGQIKNNSNRMSFKLIIWGGIGIFIIIIYFLIIIKCIKQLKNMKMVFKPQKINIGKYYRDIPRENEATPAQAAFLYYSRKNKFRSSLAKSKAFSATLLQLCLKKRIEFEKQNKEIKIIFKENENIMLKKDEEIILDLLKNAAENHESITMKELKKYGKKHVYEISNRMNDFEDEVKKEYINNRMYNLENEENLSSMRKRYDIFRIRNIIPNVVLYVFSNYCINDFVRNFDL